jgi:hypothetical protein
MVAFIAKLLRNQLQRCGHAPATGIRATPRSARRRAMDIPNCDDFAGSREHLEIVSDLICDRNAKKTLQTSGRFSLQKICKRGARYS